MKFLSMALLFFSISITELFLGALVILSFQNIVETRWVLSIEGSLKKLLRLGVLVPFLMLSLYLLRHSIYPWSDPALLKEGFQRFYFSPAFFIPRNLMYILIALVLSWALFRGKYFSGGFAMVLLLFGGTFWSLDWILSLDPRFKSTAFGLVFLASATLATYGFVLVTLKTKPEPQALQDLNTVHFTLIGSWLYLSFVQFQIIWSGNLPEEAKWYTERSHSAAIFVPWILFICQCVIPLFALLVRRWKGSLKFTRLIGGVTLLMQLIYALWIVT